MADWLYEDDWDYYYGVPIKDQKKGPAEPPRPAAAVRAENKKLVLERRIHKEMVTDRQDLLKYLGDV